VIRRLYIVAVVSCVAIMASSLVGCSTPLAGDAVMLPTNPLDGSGLGGVSMYSPSSKSSPYKITQKQTQKLTQPTASDNINPYGNYPRDSSPSDTYSKQGERHKDGRPPENSIIHAGY